MRILSDINTEISDLQMSKMWGDGAGGKRGRVMTEWKPIEGATNAPKGMMWWNNGESRFGGNYRHELCPESQPISEGADEAKADAGHQNGLDSLRD